MYLCEVCVGMDDQLDIARLNTLNNAQVHTHVRTAHMNEVGVHLDLYRSSS